MDTSKFIIIMFIYILRIYRALKCIARGVEYSTPRIQPHELCMRSSGRLDTCIETARNKPVCLATAVHELVLQAVSL